MIPIIVELFSWKTTSHKDHLEVCLPNSRLLSYWDVVLHENYSIINLYLWFLSIFFNSRKSQFHFLIKVHLLRLPPRLLRLIIQLHLTLHLKQVLACLYQAHFMVRGLEKAREEGLGNMLQNSRYLLCMSSLEICSIILVTIQV